MMPTSPATEYAFWTVPATDFKITYPLGVFHEMDFQVNEGYRRIPHGGVEIGGLLFGHAEANSAQIEAFRLIECEHASGPSFVLSERDLAGLREQIATSKTDPELHDLEVLGWFVAHTRTPLRMNEREAALFDELFPHPGKIMLLIKPERFQPTRFGFLLREADGRIARDATQHAIILPLPGRGVPTDSAPVPSISAPPETTTSKPAPPPPVPPSPPEAERLPTTGPAPRVSPPQEAERGSPRERQPFVPPEPERPPFSQALQARPTIDSAPPPVRATPVSAPDLQDATSLVPFAKSSSLPSIEEIRRRRWEYLQGMSELDARPNLQLTGQVRQESLRSNLRLTLVLFIAAAVGCGVGYLGYLQLPSATIPLSVKAEASALLVSWPAQQTRDSVYSAISIDDGQQIALSPQQRAAGQATITGASDNIKIEVIAAHWMRDSRGIIRYIKPLPPVEAQPVDTGKPAPYQTPAPTPAAQR